MDVESSYKEILTTVEYYITELKERISEVEERQVLKDVRKYVLPTYKRTLSNMLKLKRMLKNEHSVFKQEQVILDLKAFLEFTKQQLFF